MNEENVDLNALHTKPDVHFELDKEVVDLVRKQQHDSLEYNKNSNMQESDHISRPMTFSNAQKKKFGLLSTKKAYIAPTKLQCWRC